MTERETLYWLVVAFAVVGSGIGAYIASVALRRRRLERRLRELEGSRRDHA